MASRSLLSRIASLSFKSPNPAIIIPTKLSLSSHHRSFSTQSHSSTHPPLESSLDESSPPPSSNDDIPSDVSTEELRRRIDKYMEGDVEAIPSIFEAILARKLSGKHEDTDDEIMKEFQSMEKNEAVDEVFYSDESDQDLCFSEEESD